MNSKSIALVLAITLTPTSVSVLAQAPERSSEALKEAPVVDREQQLRDQMERLDRTVRQRLRTIAEQGASSDSKAGVNEEDVDRLRRHLRSLETQLHGWEPDLSTVYLDKARALGRLVENLGRAIQAPPGKVAGLSELQRALAVEWPPSPRLKVAAGDDCTDALPIGDGTYFGDTSSATVDGNASCGGGGGPDVWFAYSSPTTQEVIADTFGSAYDTLLSVHTGCPGTYNNELTCNDDTFGVQSAVRFQAQAGVQYLIRVSGCCSSSGSTGPFVLSVGPGGAMTGTVSDDVTGDPIASVEITADTNGYYAGQARTGASGEYILLGLLSGDHRAYTTDSQGYLPEIYDDLPCLHGYCAGSPGTTIAIETGVTTENIDFALNLGGAISGTVTESTTGDPIPNLGVRIWNSLGEDVVTVYTDTAGDFAFQGLYAGTHYVSTFGNSYRNELYNGILCPETGCEDLDPTTGTPVAVSFGATTDGIDFALEQLGIITGQVVETLTGFPLPNIEVIVLRADGNSAGYGYTDPTGFYRAGGLPAGTYYVRTNDYSQFFNELYDGIPCQPNCDPATGTPITVGLDETIEEIDFALERLGFVTGTVTHRPTGEPIPDTYVRAQSGGSGDGAYSNSSGNYIVDGLIPGSYSVTVEHYLHRDELYDDVPCQGGCDPAAGTPVPVQNNMGTPDIDFALEKLGSISGTVTHRTTGAPIDNIHVDLFDSNGSYVGSRYTDSFGDYLFDRLIPDTYYAVVRSLAFLDERYDNLACTETDCDPLAGTPIAANLNTITTGIDFALEQWGLITGKVTEPGGGNVEHPIIEVYDASGTQVARRSGSFNGEYAMAGLVPGTYYVVALHYSHRGELYDDIPCEASVCDPTTGVAIVADLNAENAGIDFVLDRNGVITGRVTNAATGLPATNSWIEFLATDGSVSRVEYPDGDGFYRAAGLPAGTYTAIAHDGQLGDELYNDIPCEFGCDRATGTPIPVVTATTTSGIDFALSPQGPCVPSSTNLCLAGGRFRVEVQWEDFNNVVGAGFAQALTGDSGYFWFFSPDNIELVIKVLDACYEPFDHFWIFSGGLTNIHTVVTVTDELTGDVRTYNNELGEPFQPITDTSAFATCDAGGASASSSSSRSWSVEPWTDVKTTACAPSSTSLCLNQGRFMVEAFWKAPDGATGSGQAVQLTDDAGYFWFFSANNVEVLTKVLDACGLASFENYWVFAAGLTDVEVTLRVTDTVSGEVKDYFNPPGTPYQPIQDTEAFYTCNQ